MLAAPPPPPPKPVPPPPRPTMGRPATAMFLMTLPWILVSRWIAGSSATGIADRLSVPAAEAGIEAAFWTFLLLVGFRALQMLRRERSSLREFVGLPRRATSAREFGLGVVLGWGAALGVVLLLALEGALRVQLSASVRDGLFTLVSLVSLGLLSFAEETAYRGYPFRLLLTVVGPGSATVTMALVFGLFSAAYPFASAVSVVVTVLLGVVLATGWLRTHGLWISWGLNFGWKGAAALLFGLPVNGSTSFSFSVQSFVVGRLHWTGGSYGLEGSWLGALMLLCAMVGLVRLTRDYAWNYTHPAIVAGGYPVEVAPPAAHTAMERQAAPAGTTLVQILPVTSSASASTVEQRADSLPNSTID